jgi:hypothetical protein
MTSTEEFDPRTTAWQIDESEFYELESFREQVVFMLRYAVLAPSSHNTQPWMFRVTDTGVEVFADYSQRLSVIDPDDRELVMSVGAAITNLRVAAAWFGFETTVTYQPRPEQSVPVATVEIRETCLPDTKTGRLFPAIRRRHTNRSAFTSAAIAPDAVAAICDVIDAYPETLHVLRQQHHAAVTELVTEADRELMARPAVRAELADHLRKRDGVEGDGLCTDAINVNAPLGVASWVVRNFNLGDVQAERDRDRIDKSAVTVVVTADDDRASLLQAGEILERLLLTIALNSLQYTFVNQPAEVPEIRKRLQSLALTSRMPQLMVCVGVASETVRPAPRRPVNAVVIK